ncbi:MAG TPA: TolC family protein, partial [Burkholderiales bacterium]|nr:TolC family protein [Burkholderiales bacterium]
MKARLLLALLLAGCTVGPDFVRPEAPAADHYNYGGDPSKALSQHFEKGAAPVGNWWKMFRSEKLDEIVSQGVTRNLTLQAAQASLRESRDNLQAGYGIFYPEVSASLSPARQRFSPARFGSSASGTIFNLVTLSASVSYALDIFGGEHRAIENLQSQMEFQHDVVLGTYLSLTSNIVNAAIASAAYRDEIRVTEQLVSLQKDQIAISEQQVSAGITSYAAVLALQSQLAAYEATLPP